MAEYPNFYESVKEANMRLKDTIVLYEGEPYYVLCIEDHKKDGIFRVYLDKLGTAKGVAHNRLPIPYEWHDEPDISRGEKMDKWLDAYPDEGVIRKMMNSPKFNKFRPFPLGMLNSKFGTMYLERIPTRHTQQGLTHSMLCFRPVSLDDNPRRGSSPGGGGSIDFKFTGDPMYRTIMGIYPRPDECLLNLNDPSILNSSMGFARDFAFVRGPVGLVFLAYKSDVVGYMPNSDFSKVTISSKFVHTKEAVDELQLFEDIKISNV